MLVNFCPKLLIPYRRVYEWKFWNFNFYRDFFLTQYLFDFCYWLNLIWSLREVSIVNSTPKFQFVHRNDRWRHRIEQKIRALRLMYQMLFLRLTSCSTPGQSVTTQPLNLQTTNRNRHTTSLLKVWNMIAVGTRKKVVYIRTFHRLVRIYGNSRGSRQAQKMLTDFTRNLSDVDLPKC